MKMKRRDFIKVSSTAGLLGMMGQGNSGMANAFPAASEGFDLHPFIKAHPEAVFIHRTSVEKKTDTEAIYDTAYRLAEGMFVKAPKGKGYANTTGITCKPNWTCNSGPGSDPESRLGITTDCHFVEGFLNGIKQKGPRKFYLRECACPHTWEENGWAGLAEKNQFDLRDLSSKDFWDLGADDLIFRNVDGVVFKKIGFMAPMTAPDTFLINIAKFKSHQMGITGAIKNLQGIAGKKFHQFCGGHFDIFRTYDKRYHPFFHTDYLSKVRELHEKHKLQGIPRWDTLMDRPPYGGGLFMEQWVQRMLDSYSVTTTGINMVEGIYGLDGDGFGRGPHEGKGKTYMSNQVIFGKDAFRVDIIAHWLAGHEPGNFGLFHIGIERGLSDVLDPFDIPVYLWEKGRARKVKPDSFERTPLLTSYLRRNNDGQNEERYHMCDEPFDYSSRNLRGKVKPQEPPSIRALGTNTDGRVVMEVSVPGKEDVYVDILNRHGEVVWRLEADGLEPGKHEVVWDGFSQPGIYHVYVKGMTWDAERELVIYT
ncbi:MAG: DUF362 domain-containing protein [Cyclobacteriaceae bacterium]|nr:DUF362 domain-containing protein [Cyclobacteriaceae bacterium]